MAAITTKEINVEPQTNDNEILKSAVCYSPAASENSTNDSFDALNLDSNSEIQGSSTVYEFSKKSEWFWKAIFAIGGLCFMFLARTNMPDNPVLNVEDKVFKATQGINDWVHNDQNAFTRALMLLACATQLDLIFFGTMAYWAIYGKTGRLGYSLIIFYVTRALVQMLFWCPYPAGYYWDSPGFPSFTAPYGRGSDFFFSGHSGFLVLMANEWHQWGYKKVRNYIVLDLLYTIFVLIVCQAHYSIDIFTGVFFSDYVFGKVDAHKEIMDSFILKILYNIEKVAKKIIEPVKGPAENASKKQN